MYWYGSRWYDQALGRFIQPDTDVPESQGVLAFDRYAYVNNNPLRYTDPSGHNFWDTLGELATGFVYEIARTTAWYSPQAQNDLSVSATETDAMLVGRIAADVATIAIGITEVSAGITIGTAGTAVSCGTTLCIGGVVTVGAGAVVTASGVTTALSGAVGLGDNLAFMTGRGQGLNDPDNLSDHFLRHGAEFGFNTEQEYLTAAQNFVSTKGNQGVLSTVRANGDTVIYNPTTNEFAVITNDGAIRTFFKPDPAIHGYETNIDYFYAQR